VAACQTTQKPGSLRPNTWQVRLEREDKPSLYTNGLKHSLVHTTWRPSGTPTPPHVGNASGALHSLPWSCHPEHRTYERPDRSSHWQDLDAVHQNIWYQQLATVIRVRCLCGAFPSRACRCALSLASDSLATSKPSFSGQEIYQPHRPQSLLRGVCQCQGYFTPSPNHPCCR
jgi:hypothetical protein